MESEADYLRQLEARVRSLETENKALRVASDNRNTPSGNSPGEANAKAVPQSGIAPGRMDKQHGQIVTA